MDPRRLRLRRRVAVVAAVALLAAPALAGCLGTNPDAGGTSADGADDGTAQGPATGPSNTWELPESIAGLEHVTQVEGVQSAAGIYPWGDHVYASGGNTGFYVVNVADPRAPFVEGKIEADAIGYNRDVDLLFYPNSSAPERVVAVVAQSGSGMTFIDVTDPAEPTILVQSLLDDETNVHNMAVVPGTHVIYNSRSVDTPGVDIVDASDPDNPEVVGVFNDLTCHDVAFHMPDELAACAGVRETQVWDVRDPTEPEIVSRIYNPAIQIHHQAFFAQDGDLLAILDEFAGSTSAAYGCFAHEDPGPAAASDPVGALWFYDVSDPMRPVPLSWIAPDYPQDNEVGQAPCTAHFGTVVGDDDRDLLIAGWRTAGTYLVDFSDPMMPRFVDSYEGDVETWETRYHNGYAYTGDTARGMDVLGFLGE